MFLDPRSPASMASVAQFMSNPASHLAEVVRSGRTALPGAGTVEPENPVWVAFAEKMAPMMGPMAAPLCALVLEGRPGPMHVLDMAAGHGLFGIEIAKQNPETRVTGLDWAPVLQVALENAQKAGVHERYHMLPGSAFDIEFGGPYDAVLLTNFLHHFDKPTCVELLKKVRAASGRVRGEAGVCAQRRSDFSADAGRVQLDHAGYDRGWRCLHAERIDGDVLGGRLPGDYRASDSAEPAYGGDGHGVKRSLPAGSFPFSPFVSRDDLSESLPVV